MSYNPTEMREPYLTQGDDVTKILIWRNYSSIYHWFIVVSYHRRIRQLKGKYIEDIYFFGVNT